MGCVSALGALPKFMLSPCMKEVIHMLIKQSLKLRTDQSQLTNTWAESRRDAVRALSNVAATFGFETDGGCLVLLDEVFACFSKALLEYTIDDRGDIGAWVREAAMNGEIEHKITFFLILVDIYIFDRSNLALYTLVTTCPVGLLRPESIHETMVGFAQQAVEIIDRTRGLAGSLFWKLVYQ